MLMLLLVLMLLLLLMMLLEDLLLMVMLLKKLLLIELMMMLMLMSNLLLVLLILMRVVHKRRVGLRHFNMLKWLPRLLLVRHRQQWSTQRINLRNRMAILIHIHIAVSSTINFGYYDSE